MIAIVPILPAVYSLVTIFGSIVISLGTVLGLTRNPRRRRMMLRFLWNQRFSLLVIAASLYLTWHVARSALHWVQSGRIQEQPFEQGRDWPMFRGDLQRTGVSDETEKVSIAVKKWTGGWNDEFFSSPTIVGNRVYCASGRNGTMYCWDLETGDLQWVTRLAEWRETFSSPVISAGRLYIGEGFHNTRRCRVACLEILRTGIPEMRWIFETNGHVECTPFVADDGIYVAAGSDGLYKLSLDELNNASPQVIWHVRGELLGDVETALVADAEHVFIGLGTVPYAVAALNSVNGKVRHTLNLSYPVHAPPALHEGFLYVGTGPGDYAGHYADKMGQLACIDTETFFPAWSFEMPGTILGAIVVSEKEVICGCTDGYVRVLDLQGNLLHDWDSGASILASLAVTSQQVCGINTSGRLFLLDREEFTLIADVQLGHSGIFISSPAIGRGKVVVGSQDHGLSCFGEFDFEVQD